MWIDSQIRLFRDGTSCNSDIVLTAAHAATVPKARVSQAGLVSTTSVAQVALGKGTARVFGEMTRGRETGRQRGRARKREREGERVRERHGKRERERETGRER